MRGTTSVGCAVAVAVFVAGWPALSSAQQDRPAASSEHTTDQRAVHEQAEPTTPIPPITDADRVAAFPAVEPPALGDDAVHTLIVLDQLEWQWDQSEVGLNWDAKGWVGGDRNRLRFRAESQADGGRLDDAEAHVLYGRAITRWWDVVVGVRQDVRPGPAQTWAAFGVQGLAPYWFEVEATGYVSNGGQTAVRLEADYELLLTNRLMLRPLVELNLYGKSHVERGIGSGLSSTDIGVRMRYEVRREVAPYVGVTWNNTFGETRELAEASGDAVSRLRLVAGLRLWH